MPITRSQILARGLFCGCPNCGRRGLLRSWFKLQPACTGCGMDLSKSDGFYTGTTSIGYVASILCVILPVALVGHRLALPVGLIVALCMLGSLAFVVLLYPVMLCWMVMAYHIALPEELPGNKGKTKD